MTRSFGMRSLRMRALLGVAVLHACSADTPTALNEEKDDTPGLPVAVSPPLRPGIIYDPVTGPLNTRYVLYEDSTFSLLYNTSGGSLDFAGTYTRSDSAVTFRFRDNRGSWIASGIIQRDSLTVRYNDVMLWDDFVDGVYRSSAQTLRPDNIYFATVDGSDIVRLTAGQWPAWSPDGKRIAFHRDAHVHVIDATGANEVRLVPGAHPAWSPDGKRIAFSSTSGIAVMNADGSAVTTLVRHDFRDDTYKPWDMGVGKPAWSPDGAQIAFEHFGDGDIQPAQIYVMKADGSSIRRLTTCPTGCRYAESDPSWSPDGSRLVFWSYGYGIATVAATGGEPASVYLNFPTVAYGAKPAWSPDGNTIAFATFRQSQIWTIPSKGGSTRVLIAAGRHAAWAPGGGRIAFVTLPK